MALRNSGTPAPSAAPTPPNNPAPAAGMFEEEDTTTTETTETTAAPAPAPAADEQEAKPIPGSAVVVASNNALANALRKGTNLDESQGVIGIEMLESMGIGAFPRITVDQGGFSRDKTTFIGNAIKIELLSWNYVTLVTAGEQSDKEADKLLRTSYDHKNIVSEGCTVDEYLAKLKAGNYDKATAKKYVEIYANLLWTSKDGAVAPEDVKMVQLSVSPQSVSQWQRYLLESRMKAARGLPVTNEITIVSIRKTLNSNTFGVMDFGAKV